MAFVDSVVVLQPRMTVDRYSSVERPDWTLPPERMPAGFLVSVQPASSTEREPDRPAVTTTWRLTTPPWKDLALRSVDRVEVNGEMTLSVAGDVGRFRAGAPGRVHHVEATLERVSG